MKPFRLLILLFLSPLLGSAQCPECTPDTTCGQDGEQPAVCPLMLPPATAGEYYEETLTFFLPETFQDPESGVDVELLEVLLQGIEGLPFGLEVTLDDPDGVYLPQEGQNYGCATVCGIPLIPGNYTTEINILATVLVFGSIETETTQTFTGPLTVEPGENSNSSFAFDNLAACDSLVVNFEALIDGSPNETNYFWNFGNGNSSSLAIPPPQVYHQPGEYTVSLTTEILEPVLTQVQLESLGTGWGDDLDEPFEGIPFAPDPYFEITDGNGNSVYTSSSQEDVTSYTWSGIGLALTNPPYSISFYDDDPFSSDDLLAQIPISAEAGIQSIAESGNAATLQIENQIAESFYNEEIVIVFPLPNTEFTVDEENEALYFSDTSLTNYAWLHNGQVIPGESDSLLMLDDPGIYNAVIQNFYGCMATSDDYVLCPDPVIVLDEETGELSLSEDYETYQWFLNGLPLEGETEPTLIAEENGNYAVVITTSYGCEVLSQVITVGVEESAFSKNLKIFPNPTSHYLTIEWPRSFSGRISLSVIDNLGNRLIARKTFLAEDDNLHRLDVSDLARGAYFLEICFDQKLAVRQFIVN